MQVPTLTWQELRDRWQTDDEALCRIVLYHRMPLFTCDSGKPIPLEGVTGYSREQIRVRLQDAINLGNYLEHNAQAWRDFARRMQADSDKGFFEWSELAKRGWPDSDSRLAQLLVKNQVPTWVDTEQGSILIDPRYQPDKSVLKVNMWHILKLEQQSRVRESRRRMGFVEDAHGCGGRSGGGSGFAGPMIPPRAPVGEDEALEEKADPANSERTLDQVKAEVRACFEAELTKDSSLTIESFMETARAKEIVRGFERDPKTYERWLAGLSPRGRRKKAAV
ncbi:MAG: hypothetical protein AB1646_24570 [Thermodesulfobacteriota bacterium]